MDVFFSFLTMVLIFGGLVWFANAKRKKRSEAFEREAAALGLQFSGDGSAARNRLANFNLMNIGNAYVARNLISGDAGDVKISIFDYQYTSGRGKQRRTTSQTVVALESEGIHAPEFSLRQQGAFLDRLGKLLGNQDIDFDDHPEFSKMFVLKGPDEDAIRHFFTLKLLTFFETKVGHSIEGARGKMILYKAGKRTAPEDIKDLLASAYEVYGCIVDDA